MQARSIVSSTYVYPFSKIMMFRYITCCTYAPYRQGRSRYLKYEAMLAGKALRDLTLGFGFSYEIRKVSHGFGWYFGLLLII